MTSTTQPHAALLILSQPVRVASKEMSAIDTILSITSGQKDAEKHAKARAVGGTVSTEISQAQKGAMAAGAKAALQVGSTGGGGGFSVTEYDPVAASFGFMPVQKSTDNAKAFGEFLSQLLVDYNGKFSLEKVVSLNEYLTTEKEAARDRMTSWGFKPERIEHELSSYTAERYVGEMHYRESWNEDRLKMSEMSVDRLKMAQYQFNTVFGIAVSVKINDEGRAYVDPFEVKVGGKTLLTWGQDGKFTTAEA